MAFQVNGKTALVTGGGSGICLEFTKLLNSNDCNVVIADLQLLPEAQKLVDGHSDASKPRVIFQKTDVTDWNQLQAAFDIALQEFGYLHLVCPGAGVFEPVNYPIHPPRKSRISSADTYYLRPGRTSGISTAAPITPAARRTKR